MERMPVLAFLLLLITPAWGQGRRPTPSDKPFVTVSAPTFAFRSFEDDHGGFYLIWPQIENETKSLIAQHFDAQGKAVGSERGKSLVHRIGMEAYWEAAPDAKGGVLVTWEQDNHVFIRRFNIDGNLVWPPKYERPSASDAAQTFPTLVADGSGGAFMVWQEKPVLARSVLMMQHINALGAPLWSAQGSRVSLRPSDQQRPRIVYDGSAGAIVAWNDFRESASQLQVQRVNYQGTRLWGLQGIVVTAPAGDPDRAPHLGDVGAGSAVLAWKASSSGTDRIFMQRIDASGKLSWDPQGMELSRGAWQEWNPVLHGDGEGGTWVAWEDHRNSQNWVAYVQHLHMDGSPGWAAGETALTTVAADQGHLGITDDGQKGILAAWSDNRQGTLGVYLQEIDGNGKPLLAPDGLLITTQLINPQTPQIISLTPGLAVVSWADAPSKGRWALYWKRVPLMASGGAK